MKKCRRFGEDSVDTVHAIDQSLSYGPCDVFVACPHFCNLAQLSIKRNMIVLDVGMDNSDRSASLKPATATYLIYLDDIMDIRTFAPDHDVPEEELEEGVFLLLNSDEACAIETIHDRLLLKAIVGAWQSQMLRLAAKVPKQRSSANESEASLCVAYYKEVVKGLVQPSGYHEVVELLGEMSREVLTNQSLKVLVFDTKEVLTALLDLWTKMLQKNPKMPASGGSHGWKMILIEDRKKREIGGLHRQLTSKFDDQIDLQILDNDYNQYLFTVLARRMKVIALICQVLCTIFFGSDVIATRGEAVTTELLDHPLSLSRWMNLLSMDTLVYLCDTLGVDSASMDAFLQAIVPQPLAMGSESFQTNSASMRSEMNSSLRKWPWSSPSKVAPSPSKSTVLEKDENAICLLPQLILDIRRRQAMLLFEVFRIIDSERTLLLSFNQPLNLMVNFADRDALTTLRTRRAVRKGGHVVNQRMEAQLYNAQKLASIGCYVTKRLNWELTVEGWVKLLLESLDDLLARQNIRLINGAAVSPHHNGHSQYPTSLGSLQKSASFASRNAFFASSFATLPSILSDDAASTCLADCRERRICEGTTILFYISHVIYFLAIDSASVREVLLRETLAHWASIMGIMALLCPLQFSVPTEVPSPFPKKPPPSSPTRKGQSVAASPMKSSEPDLIPSSQPASPRAPVSSWSKMFSSSLHIITSLSSPPRPQTIQPVTSEQTDNNPPRLTTPKPAQSGDGRARFSLRRGNSVGSEKSFRSRASSAWDFPSQPMHGLNLPAWRLLLLSKLRIEALLFDLLQLHPEQIYLPPMPHQLPSISYHYDEDEGEDEEMDGGDAQVLSSSSSHLLPQEDETQFVLQPPKLSTFDPFFSSTASSHQLSVMGEEDDDESALLSPNTRAKKKVRMNI